MSDDNSTEDEDGSEDVTVNIDEPLSEDSTSTEESETEEELSSEPEQQDKNDREDEQDQSEDQEMFPDGTPENLKRKVESFQNRLIEIGVQPQRVSHNMVEDEETGDEELESIALQCVYKNSSFFVIFPLNEQYTLFQSDYDVIEDMIYASDNEHLGGSFEELSPEERWKSHQRVRQQMGMEQAVGLCQSNRNINIPMLDSWVAFMRSGSERFTVETTRVQAEYLGAVVQRRVYQNPTEIPTQELYDTVSQLLSLVQGLQDILGGAYIFNGISVPDNYEELHPDVEQTERKQNQPYNKGFQ